ncbi:TonB-dependent receptor domain-containing protein [Pelagibius marinus]|uniref:TonB-dependent receptor domain-containing protein n=1 Tax=Pelagibius marinus TaxID=2762760 RepID=UPI0018727F14|nr:TonB-dependent receptor [Pelagibius marinus]
MVGRNRFWGASPLALGMALGLAAAALTPGARAAAGSAQPTPPGEAAEQVAQETPVAESGEAAEAEAPSDTISVTATRNPLKSFEYPGMVTVQDREDIQLLQPSSPDDILRFVPGVEFFGGPRRTGEAPSIRGFSGPDVIILFDGARQNYDSGHDGRFFIDPSVLKSVEVLRGSSSSLYGSGGTGGVIEFRTIDAGDLLTGDETVGATVSAGYQTANRERAGTFTGYTKPVEGLDIVGSVTKRDSGSIELGDGSELDNSDDDILSGLAKASYTFAEHHRIEGSFLSFNNTAEEPSNGQGLGSDDIVEKDIQSNTFRAAYGYHNPQDHLFDLDVLAYYTQAQADELRLDDLGAGPEGEVLKRDVDTVGFRLDNRSRAMLSDDIGATFTYGGEFYRDVQDGASASGDRDGVPDADTTFFGLFAQGEFAIAEPFGVLPGDVLIIPGLRFDSYRSTSDLAADNQDQAVSPSIKLAYLPVEWLNFFASYGHAFRAPSVDELYMSGVHFEIPVGAGVTNRFVSNPDLDPQRTQTFEFGGGFSFDDVLQDRDKLEIKASHFIIWGKDFIDLSVNQPELFIDCNPFIPGDCDGTTNSTNVPKAKLWGSEIELGYDGQRFLGSLGWSTIDGENRETGEKLGVLKADRLTVIGGVKVPEIDSLVGWRSTFAAKFDKVDDPSEERDAYNVHDIFFAWQPAEGPLEGLRVDLGVDNLFDADYERVFVGVPEQGRNFKALVSYSLKW